ncbi:MAG TPA: hydrogenase iron-sulfur subunit [Candidatus Syntrophoarchaeum butanivorans]|uniref:Coenzyme F420-reducing hydrogenase, delta subunit n=1 Tax=Candidatus Syntropharchaeum butanivorans TaxID=1839936 RepID=A0A1F2P6T8_9EURY|nr:MAG: coenzyme F420-reducing hydrogenase, delta subunit [Candidatus Syntrophoarchaeum butanivorans]RJS70823.1 MAG: hydrogenase iron-sulfur subunit [Candidatus Syntrophoarchaeum sp. WYZ-LMO15]HDM36223.1 hydrogenase iron-sulfur subunit [Candidatus Syntrophoarchaeum butanivorans]HEC57236.1 hydrogenase iron-sulfur subunit [Candidatus Syntrophoarchaeum butanivorans]
MAIERWEPKILAFCCNWCSYAGADVAGVERRQMPPSFRIIRVMCSGSVDPCWVLEAFLEGADGVLITGCHPGECHYLNTNYHTARRYRLLRIFIEELGLEPDRLRLEWISATEGIKFAEVIRDMTEKIRALGPSRLGPER